MTRGEQFRAVRGPALVLMATGVYWGALAGLMPDIKAHIGASDGMMGALLLFPATASVIAMGIAPGLGARIGGLALPLSGLLISVGLGLFFIMESTTSAAVALFLGGFAVAFSDMTANVRIAAHEARRGVHLMNVAHAMYSLSFAITALIVAALRSGGWAFDWIAFALGGLALFYVLAGWDGRDPPPADGAQETGGRSAPRDVVWLAGLVLFASFVCENAAEGWSALYIERTFGAVQGAGSLGPATFGFVMAGARFFGQAVAGRLGAERLILSSAALAVVGAAGIAAAQSVLHVHAGVVLMALGVAVIAPSTNSIIARKVSDAARARAISRAWMLGLLGFFAGPALMGMFSEIGDLRISYAAIAVIAAAIIPAILRLRHR
ncbi:MAG: MFS transporter [Maritimibacter harenae]